MKAEKSGMNEWMNEWTNEHEVVGSENSHLMPQNCYY